MAKDGLTAGFTVCHHTGTRQSLNVCRVPGLSTQETQWKKSKVLNFLRHMEFEPMTSISRFFTLNHDSKNN